MHSHMHPHAHPHVHPDDYQRRRELAKLQALELRREAIREAHAWVARSLVHAMRRWAGLLHRGQTPAVPPHLSNTHPQTPCQPLSSN